MLLFAGLNFDVGLRLFLDSFRLPGEAQKIDRIVESFGKHFYKQRPDIFKEPDVVYVLAYSVIMLNTDLHSSNVMLQFVLKPFSLFHLSELMTLLIEGLHHAGGLPTQSLATRKGDRVCSALCATQTDLCWSCYGQDSRGNTLYFAIIIVAVLYWPVLC